MNMQKLGTVLPFPSCFNNSINSIINKVLQLILYTLCVFQGKPSRNGSR